MRRSAPCNAPGTRRRWPGRVALRAALRARGVLDEGTPVEQFARYEEQVATDSARRAELDRALAARVAAEESAGEAATVRGDAVARLRTAAGAVGLSTAGDPETLVRALDGWRTARASRGAVALAERPRPAPVHPFPNGSGHASNGHAGNGHAGPSSGDRTEELQAARDAQLSGRGGPTWRPATPGSAGTTSRRPPGSTPPAPATGRSWPLSSRAPAPRRHWPATPSPSAVRPTTPRWT